MNSKTTKDTRILVWCPLCRGFVDTGLRVEEVKRLAMEDPSKIYTVEITHRQNGTLHTLILSFDTYGKLRGAYLKTGSNTKKNQELASPPFLGKEEKQKKKN